MKALLLCLALIGCGASARVKMLSTTLAVTDVAGASLRAYSKEHETSLLTMNADKAAYNAALADWRARFDHAIADITLVYQAISVAALAGDSISLTNALKTYSIVNDELKALGVLK